MLAKSIKGKSPEEIQSALEQSMADGFKPTLALVFISIHMDLPCTISIFQENGIAIFGESTAGEFTDSGIEKNSAAILLLDISPENFSILFEDMKGKSGRDVARQIGETGKRIFQHPAVILSASHIETAGEGVMEGMIDAMGADATIVGGIAGDDLMLSGGFVFTNNKFSHRGIMALFIDQDKISVLGYAVSGWKAVGTPKRITKSEGNLVYSIDDQPALDMVVKFIGLKVNTEDANDLFKEIGLSYPMQIEKDKGAPTMIPFIMYNPATKAILCGGNIPQGSVMRFSLPPDFDVIDSVIDSARLVKASSLPEVDAMIVFSCIGRLTSLGPLAADEINGLKDVWNVPLAGYFSYGEFGRVDGGNLDFHGSTCSWVVLKEK